MDLDIGAIQAQNFTLSIDNFLPLKLLENSLYGSVFRLFAKLHVNCMTVPRFFGVILFTCIRFLPYNNAFKNFCFDIFAGFILICMCFFIFSVCFTYFHTPYIRYFLACHLFMLTRSNQVILVIEMISRKGNFIYDLRAPSATPFTICFCKNKNTMIIGTIDIKTAGNINSQGFPN